MMPSEFSIVPSEIELIEACFDERQIFLKGPSWSGFRSAFGPFLSGRKCCCPGWREDRRLFGGFIRTRAAYLRGDGLAPLERASALGSIEYECLQQEIRVLLLDNTLGALRCSLDQCAIRCLARLSARFASTDVQEEMPSVITSCHDRVCALMDECPALRNLAAGISREDPRWLTHTAWQILFATTESTALTIEVALALKLGMLPLPSGSTADDGRLETARDILRLALIYYPSTYDMVFDIQERPRDLEIPGEVPASIHVPVDLANRVLCERSGRYRHGTYGFTFGGGPRRCPGRNLALMEAEEILRILIQEPPRNMPKSLQYNRRGFFAHLAS